MKAYLIYPKGHASFKAYSRDSKFYAREFGVSECIITDLRGKLISKAVFNYKTQTYHNVKVN